MYLWSPNERTYELQAQRHSISKNTENKPEEIECELDNQEIWNLVIFDKQ